MPAWLRIAISTHNLARVRFPWVWELPLSRFLH